jgi:hypothetical protein
MSMKLPSPSIFLEAARLIGQSPYEECACNMLWDASGKTDADIVSSWENERDVLPAVRYFTALLKPAQTRYYAWYAQPVGPAVPCVLGHGTDWKNNTARIMGLTLCALLVEEGFVPPGFKAARRASKR